MPKKRHKTSKLGFIAIISYIVCAVSIVLYCFKSAFFLFAFDTHWFYYHIFDHLNSNVLMQESFLAYCILLMVIIALNLIYIILFLHEYLKVSRTYHLIKWRRIISIFALIVLIGLIVSAVLLINANGADTTPTGVARVEPLAGFYVAVAGGGLFSIFGIIESFKS